MVPIVRQDIGDGRLLLPLLAVPCSGMANLVAQHTGHLCLAVAQGRKLAGDVDIAALDGEGVVHGRIEESNRELALAVCQARLQGDFLAHAFDIGGFRALIRAAEFLQDFRVIFRTIGLFLGRKGQRVRCFFDLAADTLSVETAPTARAEAARVKSSLLRTTDSYFCRHTLACNHKSLGKLLQLGRE
jgi:hypothetical protein